MFLIAYWLPYYKGEIKWIVTVPVIKVRFILRIWMSEKSQRWKYICTKRQNKSLRVIAHLNFQSAMDCMHLTLKAKK